MFTVLETMAVTKRRRKGPSFFSAELQGPKPQYIRAVTNLSQFPEAAKFLHRKQEKLGAGFFWKTSRCLTT